MQLHATGDSKALGTAKENFEAIGRAVTNLLYPGSFQTKFINEEIIPVETWVASEAITKDVDIDDTDFVALTKFLRATLWTGDKVLYSGLTKLNFKKLVNTTELLALRSAKIGK